MRNISKGTNKRDPYSSKETHIHQKRPIFIKKRPVEESMRSVSKETDKRSLYEPEETHRTDQ